jgi:hypothetical protein
MALKPMQKLKDWILQEGSILLLELALVAALAVSLAHWTWIVLAPRAIAAPSSLAQPEETRPGALAKRHLLGASTDGVAAGEGSAVSTSRLKLLGVFSRGNSGAGRAILAPESGRPVTALTGEAVVPGIVLQEVRPDHVLLLRDGIVERVNLERRVVEFKPAAARQVQK